MSEDEPTAEELEEARALAEALDGDGATARDDRDERADTKRPPRDALEAAALLRYAHDSELDAQREAAIGRELADSIGDRHGRSGRVTPATAAATVAVAVAIAAAVAIFWRTPAADLPPPQLALLRAQAEIIGASGRDLAALQDENDRYRERWLVSMRARYEGTR